MAETCVQQWYGNCKSNRQFIPCFSLPQWSVIFQTVATLSSAWVLQGEYYKETQSTKKIKFEEKQENTVIISHGATETTQSIHISVF